MNKESFEFQVGDEVEWNGERSTLVKGDVPDYPLKAFFVEIYYGFTRDGRFKTWHKEPSLKLISRKKQFKKVKKYKSIILSRISKKPFVDEYYFNTPEEAMTPQQDEEILGYQEIDVMIQE